MIKNNKNDSKIIKYAKREFYLAGFCDEKGNFEDEYQESVCKDVLELLRVFHKQRHSGFSSSFASYYFNRLVNWKPLSPLTGKDDKWGCEETIAGETTQQNNRSFSVWKNKDGKAYWHDAKIFVEPKGTTFTSTDSKEEINFPFDVPDSPSRIKVDENGNPIQEEVKIDARTASIQKRVVSIWKDGKVIATGLGDYLYYSPDFVGDEPNGHILSMNIGESFVPELLPYVGKDSKIEEILDVCQTNN